MGSIAMAGLVDIGVGVVKKLTVQRETGNMWKT